MQLALPRQHPHLFYGWYIVGVALLAQCMSSGTQSYAIGLFLKPMTHELGLLLGGLIDRRGPRPLMLLGSVIAGAALVGTSRVQTLWQFYLLRGCAQTVGMAMLGNLVVNVTLSMWFIVRRGMAVAIASVGVSLGGVLIAPLAAGWIQDYGWRSTWIHLGLITWLLMLPASLLMRRMPEDHGLLADGVIATKAACTAGEKPTATVAELQWTRREALRTRAIWLVICAYGTANIGLGALLLHMVPFLTDNGFSRGTAALLFSIQAWASLVSKPVWGLLMNRFHARNLSAVGFMMAAASMLGMLGAASTGSIWVMGAVLSAYGFGIGGTIPLQETVWASYFGRAHLGEIRAVAMPFAILFGAGGPLLAGALYDRSGSYQSTFIIFAAFSLVGFLLVLFARPPQLPARGVEHRR